MPLDHPQIIAMENNINPEDRIDDDKQYVLVDSIIDTDYVSKASESYNSCFTTLFDINGGFIGTFKISIDEFFNIWSKK